jgi:hypothetical protein
LRADGGQDGGGVLSVACAGGLFHGSQGLPLAGTRGDGDQVSSLATGGDGDEQAIGHAVEPAKPDDAAARWAIDPQPVSRRFYSWAHRGLVAFA